MGLEPYLISSSLNLIIAQRLIRRLCDHCKQPIRPNEELLSSLRLTSDQVKGVTLFGPEGCHQCDKTGYKGRVPIFEFLPVWNELRQRITRGAGEMDIRTMAREKGYGDLMDSGVRRFLEGQTSADEVLRVTFKEDTE
jgi:type IV pilus assembly protein PilB